MKESIPLFEQAISLDPEFAMALRSLGSAYRNIGGTANIEKVNENLLKALELRFLTIFDSWAYPAD